MGERAGRRWWDGLRARLTQLPRGLVEAIGAVIVAVLFLGPRERFANDQAGFVLEITMLAAAGAVGVWPVGASIAAALAMTGLLILPLELQRPTLTVIAIVVGSLVSRGRRALATVIAAWWLGVTWFLESTPIAGTGPKPLSQALTGMAFWFVFISVAWAFGQAVNRLKTERAQSLVDRTAAMQAQRRTIARDLHDTVAYSTTSIILRAEQAKLRGVADPELVADLDYIINAGRNSMRDLRGMMETLRRNEPGGAEARAPWQISSLDEVLASRTAELREHGFSVTSHVDADLSALPESVRETLGKVVVEATANMVKHGDPSGPASILIEATEDDFEAVFINKPKSAGTPRAETAQLGLIGARERVEALGGEFQVASKSPTWVVRARIPLEA